MIPQFLGTERTFDLDLGLLLLTLCSSKEFHLLVKRACNQTHFASRVTELTITLNFASDDILFTSSHKSKDSTNQTKPTFYSKTYK